MTEMREFQDYLPIETEVMQNTMLLVSDHYGIYAWQHMFESYNKAISGVSDEDRDIILAGPDHPEYFDTIEFIESNIRLTDDNGDKWCIQQDGDIWAIREGYELPDYWGM